MAAACLQVLRLQVAGSPGRRPFLRQPGGGLLAQIPAHGGLPLKHALRAQSHGK